MLGMEFSRKDFFVLERIQDSVYHGEDQHQHGILRNMQKCSPCLQCTHHQMEGQILSAMHSMHTCIVCACRALLREVDMQAVQRHIMAAIAEAQ